MRLALAEAEAAAAAGEVPVGAVIWHASLGLIGSGGNRCETDHDATAHAEMLALRQAAQRLGDWRLEDCTLYVTLEPCPMCLGACLNARIARVVYGASEPKAGACGSVVDLRAPPGYNHRVDTTGGIFAEESAKMLKNFFRALRQRHDAPGGTGAPPACGPGSVP